MRVKAVIAYNGSRFFGFQRQNSTRNTVANRVEEALKRLNIDSSIVGAGRTDAGVHASGQVIHFDIPPYWNDIDKLTRTLNETQDVEFKRISRVADDFHARFDAKRRIYRYVSKSKKPTIFEQDFIAHMPVREMGLLSQALDLFVGVHDFGNFIKSGSVTKTNVREIYRAVCVQRGRYIFIYFEANGFLRAQVRMMLDFAFKVANGELSLTQLKEQLSLESTYSRGLAPAEGLYLARVIY